LPIGKIIIITCMLAGAMAGMAGAVEVAAVQGSANATVIAGYGYTGILVAFLARQNPLVIIPVSLLLGGIEASNGILQRRMQLPDATVRVLQGTLFLIILASETYYGRLKFFQKKDLVGVLARQAVRVKHVEAVEAAGPGQVAQPLECRTLEGRAAIAVVDELHRLGDGIAVRGDALAQGRQLRGDRAGLGLLCARDAGVQGDLEVAAHRDLLQGAGAGCVAVGRRPDGRASRRPTGTTWA
jgi:hypothetical protein